MNILEKKIDALMRFCAAETDDARDEALNAIRDLQKGSAGNDLEVASMNEDMMIRRVLLELGVPDHLKGHQYLTTAIAMVISDPDAVRGITKKLYPQLAEMYRTTAPKVERTIRLAIETAWDRGDQEALRKYFGSTANPLKGKSTNKEFIVRVANAIRTGV